MKRILLLMAAAAMLLTFSCKDKGPDLIKAGDTLPEFSLSSEVYGDISSSDLDGKVTYLCFLFLRYLVPTLPAGAGRSAGYSPAHVPE